MNHESIDMTVDATGDLPEDMTFGLHVREWELDLSVNTTWSNQSGVEGLDPVRGHDNFDVSPCIKSVELVEELQHSPLNFTFTT
jgi:hypothetical protein